MGEEHTHILVITGPVGVGKTAVADAVSSLLGERGVPNAVIDLDALRMAYPAPDDDPFHMQVGFENLRAVWPQYAKRGIRHVVIPTVIEDASDRLHFTKAIPHARVTVALLAAPPDVLRRRLQGREQEGLSLQWHIQRAEELTRLFRRRQLEDFVVANEGRGVRETAEEVIGKWLGKGEGDREGY